MTEAHSSEVERLLLYISDARDRAARTTEAVERSGEAHVSRRCETLAVS